MLKYNLQKLLKENQRAVFASTQQVTNFYPRVQFSSQNGSQSKDTKTNQQSQECPNRKPPKNMHKSILGVIFGTGLIMLGSSLPTGAPTKEQEEAKIAKAEGQDPQSKERREEPMGFQQLPKFGFSSIFKKKTSEDEPRISEVGKLFSDKFRPALSQFEIPKLLNERERQVQEELDSRELEDLSNLVDEDGKRIRISPEEFREMQKQDARFSYSRDDEAALTPEEREELERASYVKDPYARQEAMKMKHQEYRTIKVGPYSLLQNGQMVQVSVCDAFDEKKFHPTDKLILLKHNDKYYCTGSFCGFDFTNLGTGAFLGEKLICPTCGSVYNIVNGFVDQGPSLRNISSFLVQNKEEQINVVIPESIPAFSLKEHVKKSIIDPRTYVVLGDSEAALSVIDSLRSNFTGKIISIPCSPYGQFENVDILHRQFGPLEKNQVFLVEKDYMDRANVEVVKGEVRAIDFNKKTIKVNGQKKPIEFDKIMIAWGSYKQRLQNQSGNDYSNVFYLEDRFSHAKCHNEILKAKTIMVMGGTFEAFQAAASLRDYLDSINYTATEIILFNSEISEVQHALGTYTYKKINELLKQKRISVVMNADVQRFQGLDKLEAVYFKKQEDTQSNGNVEYFIKPDVVIAENGLGAPKMDLKELLTPALHAESNEPPIQIGFDREGLPSSDVRFSLHYNDIHSPIFAAGSCTSFPSFFHKTKIRTQDVKYNIESSFFAAMNMLDKRVEFKYIPMTSLKIGDTPIYFVGERTQPFNEIIVQGDMEKGKYVIFYVFGKEICGFVTVGFQNLHLYLWEAMKMMIMPAAAQVRSQTLDYRDIVKAVLKSRKFIHCKRHKILGLPSITLAESEKELEEQKEFNTKLRDNIKNENEIQKKKFQQLKKKYDREGVNFIENELEIIDKEQKERADKKRAPGGLARTASGGLKPGKSDTDLTPYQSSNYNMGGDSEQNNPVNLLMNMARGKFKD